MLIDGTEYFAFAALLSLGAVLRVPGVHQQTLRNKAHEHKTNSIVDVSTTFAAELLAIGLLLQGFGLLALVLGNFLATAAFSATHVGLAQRRSAGYSSEVASLRT